MTKIQELEKKLQDVSGKEKVDILNELAMLLKFSNLEKSESFVGDATKLSEEIEYYCGNAKSNIVQGQIHSIRGSLDKAEKCFL